MYTRVERLSADMRSVTLRMAESAFIRTVSLGTDGLYHVRVVADAPMKVVRMRGQYLDNQLAIPHGEFTFFYPNGRKESNGSYVKGAKNGSWSRWTLSGEQAATREYTGRTWEEEQTEIGLTSYAATLPSSQRRWSAPVVF